MASVRITHSIRQFVRNRFEAMFNKRLTDKINELQHLGVGEACYNHYVPARARQLAQELNAFESWIPVTETINISVTYTCSITGKDKTVVFSVAFKPPVPLPKRFTSHWNTQITLIPSIDAYQHVVKILHEYDAILAERDNLIHTMVDGVLTECGSLRQVLEHWPNALDFMPEDARAEHARKAEKRESRAKNVAIDDAVKASLLKARMLSGGT